MVVSYKECMKNHAATIGGHALDGCGEFMPSPTANSDDPSSLKCAACGCHRNFHRRDHDPSTTTNTTHFVAPPPTATATAVLQGSPSPSTDPSTAPSPDTNSPPQQPVTSPAPCSYYSSAPHMLLALSTAGYSDHHHYHPQPSAFNQVAATKSENPCARKRSRTKFTQEQKEKMLSFAEKLGWRMNRGEEKLTQEFCNEVGVRRRVFKVWMHNNKNLIGKKDQMGVTADINKKIDSVNNGSSGVRFDINHNEGSIHQLFLSPKSEDE